MGSNVIGSGVSDPDFYARQSQLLGSGIASIVGSYRKRQEEQAAADQEEIDRAFKAMQQMPEMADTWGQALVQKYGDSHPEVPAMVSAIQHRYQLARQIPEAQKAWTGAWQKRQADYNQQQQAAAALPDLSLAQNPGGMFGAAGGGFVQLNPENLFQSNPEKQAALQKLRQVDPSLFPAQAIQDLPPEQQLAAHLAAKEAGYQLPKVTAFDRYSDLPPQERGLEAVRAGLIPKDSDTAQALLNASKLQQTTARLQEQQFQQGERGARQSFDEKILGERDTAMKERMILADNLSKAKSDRQLGNSETLASYRASLKAGGNKAAAATGSTTYKDLVAATKSSATDWDAGQKLALAGLTGDTRAAAAQKFAEDNGPRPHVISPYAAKQISAMAGSDDDILTLATSFSHDVASGVSEVGALNNLRVKAARKGAPAEGAPSVKTAAAPAAIGGSAPPKAKPKLDAATVKAKIKAQAPPGTTPAQIEQWTREFIAAHGG